MILTHKSNYLYSSDSTTDCYYSNESTSESSSTDELLATTQRNPTRIESEKKLRLNNYAMDVNPFRSSNDIYVVPW